MFLPLFSLSLRSIKKNDVSKCQGCKKKNAHYILSGRIQNIQYEIHLKKKEIHWPMYKFIKLKKNTGRKYTKNADSVYVCQKLFFSSY